MKHKINREEVKQMQAILQKMEDMQEVLLPSDEAEAIKQYIRDFLPKLTSEDKLSFSIDVRKILDGIDTATDDTESERFYRIEIAKIQSNATSSDDHDCYDDGEMTLTGGYDEDSLEEGEQMADDFCDSTAGITFKTLDMIKDDFKNAILKDFTPPSSKAGSNDAPGSEGPLSGDTEGYNPPKESDGIVTDTSITTRLSKIETTLEKILRLL